MIHDDVIIIKGIHNIEGGVHLLGHTFIINPNISVAVISKKNYQKIFPKNDLQGLL